MLQPPITERCVPTRTRKDRWVSFSNFCWAKLILIWGSPQNPVKDLARHMCVLRCSSTCLGDKKSKKKKRDLVRVVVCVVCCCLCFVWCVCFVKREKCLRVGKNKVGTKKRANTPLRNELSGFWSEFGREKFGVGPRLLIMISAPMLARFSILLTPLFRVFVVCHRFWYVLCRRS